MQRECSPEQFAYRMDYYGGARRGVYLQDAVKYWPTPRVGNPGSRRLGTGGKVLAEEVQKSMMWPPPMASDTWCRGPNSKQQGLPEKVRMFPTPGAGDAQKCHMNPVMMKRVIQRANGEKPTAPSGAAYQESLPERVTLLEFFPTPRAREGNAGAPGSAGSKHNAERGYLDGTVQEAQFLWRSPSTSDASRGVGSAAKALVTGEMVRESGSPKQMSLRAQVAAENLIQEGYSASNLPTTANGRLNPTWVEWLMGFPTGWTDLDASATPSMSGSPTISDSASCASTKGGEGCADQ